MMIATTHNTEKWSAVTRQAPCVICQKPDWCVVSPDGAIAGCMREKGKGYFKTAPTDGGDMYLHRPTEAPRERPTPRPQPVTTPARDIMADRAVFGIVAQAGATLPRVARDELARRFGPVYGPQAVARFGIGYGDTPALIAALDAAGRRQDAIRAGVLYRDGTASRTLEGKLIIPHVRDGLIQDIRLAGIKAVHETTKEISLPGAYAERGIADLFFNHDALNHLGVDGVLHVCGGAYKAMALILAGVEHAVGLRGEAELSAGHIAALHAAGVRTIILHIDNEDPKPGEARSAGRRLGLVKAERLAAAGFAVLIAEPPREPGTPKVDPDALLRDLGPRAVRDYALSAIPLDAWRLVLGAAPTVSSADTPPESDGAQDRVIAGLRAQLTAIKELLTSADMTPIERVIAFGVANEAASARSRQPTEDAGADLVINQKAIAANVRVARQSVGAALDRWTAHGHLRKQSRPTGQVTKDGKPLHETLIRMPATDLTDNLLLAATWKRPAGTPHVGGNGRRCPKCASSAFKKTEETAQVLTTTITCADCGHMHETRAKVLGATKTYVEFGDFAADIPTAIDPAALRRAGGVSAPDTPPCPRIDTEEYVPRVNRATPPPPVAVSPRGAAVPVSGVDTPEPAADLQPRDAVEPAPPAARRPSGPAAWDGTHPCRGCGATCYARAGAVPRCLPCARGRSGGAGRHPDAGVYGYALAGAD